MKKLSTKAFICLLTALILGLAAVSVSGIILVVNYIPVLKLSENFTANIFFTLHYSFYRSMIVFVIIAGLNIAWLILLIKDKIKPAKRTYLIIMLGFHVLYILENIAELCDNAIAMANLSGLSTAESYITPLVIACVLLIADILVFTGYFLQKKAPKKAIAPPKIFPVRTAQYPPQSYPPQYPPPQYPPQPTQSYPPSYPPNFRQ